MKRHGHRRVARVGDDGSGGVLEGARATVGASTVVKHLPAARTRLESRGGANEADPTETAFRLYVDVVLGAGAEAAHGGEGDPEHDSGIGGGCGGRGGGVGTAGEDGGDVAGGLRFRVEGDQDAAARDVRESDVGDVRARWLRLDVVAAGQSVGGGRDGDGAGAIEVRFGAGREEVDGGGRGRDVARTAVAGAVVSAVAPAGGPAAAAAAEAHAVARAAAAAGVAVAAVAGHDFVGEAAGPAGLPAGPEEAPAPAAGLRAAAVAAAGGAPAPAAAPPAFAPARAGVLARGRIAALDGRAPEEGRARTVRPAPAPGHHERREPAAGRDLEDTRRTATTPGGEGDESTRRTPIHRFARCPDAHP